MTYNPNNKTYCETCEKNINKKYYKKHCIQKRHLRLKAIKDANKTPEPVRNIVGEIKTFINKYGVENVREVCDMINGEIEEIIEEDPISDIEASMRHHRKLLKEEVVDVGADCWDIINSYKSDLELTEKLERVHKELREYKTKAEYDWIRCINMTEPDFNQEGYIYDQEDCNYLNVIRIDKFGYIRTVCEIEDIYLRTEIDWSWRESR